ncbi:hypothetical protein HYW60_01255 [Candidatus Kaiserbacteria bacterium]|nr:hypothetical protein [Candidatus Kaiserbacteria bacterium]
MATDLKTVDEQMQSLDRSMPSVDWLMFMIETDVSGMRNCEAMRASARLYGNTKRLATIAQLAFIHAVAKRDPLEAAELMHEMDQLSHLAAEDPELARDIEESGDFGA